MGKERTEMRLLKFVLIACIAVVFTSGAVLAQEVGPRPMPVSGIITAIDLVNSKVTLNGPTAEQTVRPPVTFLVTRSTKIVKDGKPADLGALAVGDMCNAGVLKTSSGELVAVFVNAQTPKPKIQWAKGKIEKISYGTGIFALRVPDSASNAGRIMTFAATNTTKIVKDGKPVEFTALRVGDLAAVGFFPPPPSLLPVEKPIPAVIIEAKTPPEAFGRVVGKISQIAPDRKVIFVVPAGVKCLPGEKCALAFQITSATAIRKFIANSFEALCVGDAVEVVFMKNTDSLIPPAVQVMVMPETAEGIIGRVDVQNGVVVLKLDAPWPVAVVQQTEIFKDGRPAPLETLAAGDFAAVKFFHFRERNVAAAIFARSARPVPVPPPPGAKR